MAFTAELLNAGISGSIGTVGDALDNALCESTIGLCLTPRIVRPQACPQAQARTRVTPPLPRFIAESPQTGLTTGQGGHGWTVIDITDEFGAWLASHRHAEALFEDPREFTPAIPDKFEAELVTRIRDQLAAAPGNNVDALVGIGSIFPFLRALLAIARFHLSFPRPWNNWLGHRA